MSIDQANNNDTTTLPAQPATQLAFEILKHALQQDGGYAWSWFCNLCMAFVDAGGDRLTAHRASARFMHHTFDVNIERTLTYRDAIDELMSDAPQPAPAPTATQALEQVYGKDEQPDNERFALLRSMVELTAYAKSLKEEMALKEKASADQLDRLQKEAIRMRQTLENAGYEDKGGMFWSPPINRVAGDAIRTAVDRANNAERVLRAAGYLMAAGGQWIRKELPDRRTGPVNETSTADAAAQNWMR